MWLMIFFDLPVKSKLQRTSATRFRNALLNDGFIMIQFSVYARVCRGQEAVDKHLHRTRLAMPKAGSIRALQVTDKQYGRMELMLGLGKKIEKKATKQMVLL
ncbi:CRISPR-associated endonuclease Cas2 [Acetobacteraceae bacterium]|nr:CRISPR-associated endonuclease Cas2 [Acetobacteraceae bacterium]